MNRIASVIAHDFNGLLTSILGNIYLARTHIDSRQEVLERLRNVEQACMDAKSLTRKLMALVPGATPARGRQASPICSKVRRARARRAGRSRSIHFSPTAGGIRRSSR
jgi:signal transduction histidine kinase